MAQEQTGTKLLQIIIFVCECDAEWRNKEKSVC